VAGSKASSRDGEMPQTPILGVLLLEKVLGGRAPPAKDRREFEATCPACRPGRVSQKCNAWRLPGGRRRRVNSLKARGEGPI